LTVTCEDPTINNRLETIESKQLQSLSYTSCGAKAKRPARPK